MDYTKLSDEELLAIKERIMAEKSAARPVSEMSDEELLQRRDQLSNSQQGESYSGTVLPFSRDAEGNVSFDSDAGILGPLKRAFNLPGKVMSGEVQMHDPSTGKLNMQPGGGIDQAIEAGAVLTPGGAARRHVGPMSPMTKKAPPPAAPDSRQLMTAGKMDYRKLNQSGIKYSPENVRQEAMNIGKTIFEETGITDQNAPQTYAKLVQLAKNPEMRSNVKQIHSTLRRLRSIARKTTNGEEATAAGIAARHLKSFIERDGGMGVPGRPQAGSIPGLPAPGGSPSLPRGGAGQLLNEADANWAAASRSKAIELDLLNKQNKTNSANSGGNLANNLRRIAGDIAAKPKKQQGLNKGEIAEFQAVNTGSKGANRARNLSNRLGGGGGVGNSVLGGMGFLGGGGAAHMAGASPGWVAAAAAVGAIPSIVGPQVRKVANGMTEKAFNRALDRVRRRSPLYRRMLSENAEKTLRSPALRRRAASAEEQLNRAILFELMQERQK